jgi:hypothetical protein
LLSGGPGGVATFAELIKESQSGQPSGSVGRLAANPTMPMGKLGYLLRRQRHLSGRLLSPFYGRDRHRRLGSGL